MNRRIILDDSRKRRLAAPVGKVGKRLLEQMGTTRVKWNGWFIAGSHGGFTGRRGYGLLLAVALMGLVPAVAAGQARAARPAAIKPAETRPAAASKAREPNSMIPELRQAILRLTPLHKPLEKPQSGDWLAQHKEPGQTFAEYLGGRPATPRGRRSVLYVQALGPLTPTQRKIVDLTREYLACYFGVTCRQGADLPDALVPASARRTHPAWGDKQILSTYVLDKVLKPRLPPDAAACIALTASDLWPGEGWNFVFGQASLQDRVGVWSLCRFGDPNESDKAFRLCLRRTLQTASHETGHMFSILHCTAWQCNMCGSNSLPESDRRPTWLCPQCTAKVCWAAGYDPGQRFRNLADFCRKAGLSDEVEFYRKSLETLPPAWPSRFAGRGEDWCCPVKQFPDSSFFLHCS